MKKYLWLIMFLGCSSSVNTPEPEPFKFEYKFWGVDGTRKAVTTYLPWEGLSGLKVAYFVRNTSNVDLKFDFVLHIYGARHHHNFVILIPIESGELLSSTQGLVCMRIAKAHIDPIGIIDSGIIRAGESGYVVAFAEIDWGNPWGSVYSTVEITATESSLSKGIYRTWEITTEPIEVKIE